jgi:hypothetical protein
MLKGSAAKAVATTGHAEGAPPLKAPENALSPAGIGHFSFLRGTPLVPSQIRTVPPWDQAQQPGRCRLRHPYPAVRALIERSPRSAALNGQVGGSDSQAGSPAGHQWRVGF